MDVFRGNGRAEDTESLLVVGSGAIGIEFASFYRTMGAEVTVVEILPQILPVEDEEIAAHARKRFEKAGIKIHTETKVAKLVKAADSVTASLEFKDGKKEDITFDRVISAVGVVGNIENLGLEKLGVKIERGTIVIDKHGRTNVPGVWAIGDVAGPPMLAHKAEHEGRHRRRSHRRTEPARDGQTQDSGLHVLQSADRVRRAYRGKSKSRRLRHPLSASFRSSATARLSHSASRKVWSRRFSTRKPGSCSVPISSARK